MQRPAGDRWLFWVTLGTLMLAVVMAIVGPSIFVGELKARVTTLEDSTKNEVTKDEWRTFRQDLKDRLDRIENKLDQQAEGKR